MKISDSPSGIEWLRQFDVADVYPARLLLDSLRLVSLNECEEAISRILERICSQTTGKIALKTADKKLITPAFSTPGSEGRLAHLFKNIQRQFDERILAEPTIDEMRAAKVDHVILVDDFVCSGQRIEDFWDAWTTLKESSTVVRKGKVVQLTRKRGTLRSWLSLGYCKLWLVAYAIHETGLKRLLRAIPYLKEERIRSKLVLKEGAVYWPVEVSDFLSKRRELAVAENGGFGGGWGNLNVPLVFQHGCPDNCPEILWQNGNTYRAIFPSRSVPTALFPCFDGKNDSGRDPSLLMATGQYRLALALIGEISEKLKNPKYSDILTVLGLINAGFIPQNLAKSMLREEAQIQELIATAREMGLLDSDFRVTNFGRDILDRSRKSHLTIASKVDSEENSQYIPMQFRNQICGVQRKSRNEPESKP